MSRIIVTPPTEYPVSLAEAKAHLRVDLDHEDTEIQQCVAAATERAEEFRGEQFCTAVWRLALDRFPSACERIGWSETYPFDRGAIVPPRPPLISVASITYVDTNGATQTLSPSAYQVDAISRPGRIVPAYGESWPATRSQPNAVLVQYSAGYGAASAVPAKIKQAILLMTADLFWNRGDEQTRPIPAAAENLLRSNRILRVA